MPDLYLDVVSVDNPEVVPKRGIAIELIPSNEIFSRYWAA